MNILKVWHFENRVNGLNMGFAEEKPIEADEGVLATGCIGLGGKGDGRPFGPARLTGEGDEPLFLVAYEQGWVLSASRTRGQGRSTMGRGVGLKDILGAFNETVAELSDPDLANSGS